MWLQKQTQLPASRMINHRKHRSHRRAQPTYLKNHRDRTRRKDILSKIKIEFQLQEFHTPMLHGQVARRG